MRAVSAVLLAAVLAAPAPAGAAERVDLGDAGGPLRGVLYRPQGPGPFPGVVALHGCGGLVNRRGRIDKRFRAWGERLAAAGIAVVFPDSFTSHGIANQCRAHAPKVRTARERVTDANVARRWLPAQPWTKKDHVSLMGWSSGAVATLWAVRPRVGARDGMPDFRSAVALYPGCHRLTNSAWSGRVPTLILIGRADDWTPAAACEQMVAGARGRSAMAALVVYPGAYHEFDRADYPLRMLNGLAHSADGTGRAHAGGDPAARDDAFKRVAKWLSR